MDRKLFRERHSIAAAGAAPPCQSGVWLSSLPFKGRYFCQEVATGSADGSNHGLGPLFLTANRNGYSNSGLYLYVDGSLISRSANSGNDSPGGTIDSASIVVPVGSHWSVRSNSKPEYDNRFTVCLLT